MRQLALSAFCSLDKDHSYCTSTLLAEMCTNLINPYTLRFSQADVQDIAPHIINALLTKLEAGQTPQKVAENDYVMKCS